MPPSHGGTAVDPTAMATASAFDDGGYRDQHDVAIVTRNNGYYPLASAAAAASFGDVGVGMSSCVKINLHF